MATLCPMTPTHAQGSPSSLQYNRVPCYYNHNESTEPVRPCGCSSNMYPHAQFSTHNQLAHAHGPCGWKPISNMAMDPLQLGDIWRG